MGQDGASHETESFGAPRAALLFVGFALLALAVYAPSLSGPPISDDFLYIENNPYIQPLTARHLVELFDPFGPAKAHFTNYAPVHVAAHGVQEILFGNQLAAYHVTNVMVHTLASIIFVLVLIRSGVSDRIAVFAGAFFLLHPAHVEAVAWISQLKSTGAMALALAALLTLDRRPILSSVLFSLALLTKAHATFVLPLAAVRLWTLGDGATRRAWLGVAVWTVVFALYAPVQWEAFRAGGTPPSWDPLALPNHARMVVATVARYAVMAVTGRGLSAIHDPHRSDSWLDPWFLGGVILIAALGARCVWAMRARREEAAWWLCAAAAFMPVSQVVAFHSPIADRYVYFFVPGLLGGAVVAGTAWWRSREIGVQRAARAERGLALAGVLIVSVFALQSYARSAIWTHPQNRITDSVRSNPEGDASRYLAARSAARRGDAAEAVDLLRQIARSNLTRTRSLASDPYFAVLRSDPRFLHLLREISQRYVDHAVANGYDSELWLQSLGIHYTILGRFDDAIATLERGARRYGPLRENLLANLEAVREARMASIQPATRNEGEIRVSGPGRFDSR